MDELFSDPDAERARRAMEAMFEMRKLDIATLRAAADGVPAA
jgi:predicted 3-demethylubiquinone-9 3-methyltransferase (glyoxalase superfamily)